MYILYRFCFSLIRFCDILISCSTLLVSFLYLSDTFSISMMKRLYTIILLLFWLSHARDGIVYVTIGHNFNLTHLQCVLQLCSCSFSQVWCITFDFYANYYCNPFVVFSLLSIFILKPWCYYTYCPFISLFDYFIHYFQ